MWDGFIVWFTMQLQDAFMLWTYNFMYLCSLRDNKLHSHLFLNYLLCKSCILIFFFFFPHCLCVLPPFLWVGHMHVCMRQPFDSSWFAPLSLSISEIFASLGNKWSLIWWQFLLWVIIWATFFLPLLFPIRFFFFSFLSGSFLFFGCGTRSSSGLGVRDQYEPLICYLILFLIKKKNYECSSVALPFDI